MRIFVWHGYLLSGTGSNIYARQLSREWSREGHDVTVFSQDPDPSRFDLGGAATARPEVHGLLPVFVLDDYAGYRVELLQNCTQEELDTWVAANVAALREHGPADLVFVNHVLLGGPVGAGSGSRYVVKAHGSELEYSMRGNERLSRWGADALTGAAATIVGSEHIREVLAEICGTVDRVHTVPPGVDVELWRPQPREAALDALVREARYGDAARHITEALRLTPPDEREDNANTQKLFTALAGVPRQSVTFGKDVPVRATINQLGSWDVPVDVNGRRGQWTISQSGTGSLDIEDDDPMTLYCPRCRFSPFK